MLLSQLLSFKLLVNQRISLYKLSNPLLILFHHILIVFSLFKSLLGVLIILFKVEAFFVSPSYKTYSISI